MRFRLTVTQLRIVILVANVLLSGGVLAYASYSYWVVHPDKGAADLAFAGKRVPLDAFTWKESEARVTTRSSALEIQAAPDLFQPKKPPELPKPDPEAEKVADSTTTTATGPGAYSPGPLAEKNWKFVSFILWPDDPLDNQAILRREADPAGGVPGARPGSTARPVRTRTVIRPQGAVRPGQPRTVAKNPDRVPVTVRDRVFTVDDGGTTLAFLVDSVDAERFVYSEYSKPTVLYALPYELPGEYLGKPDEGLRPPPPPPDATGEGGAAPEAKTSIIQIVSDDFRDRKEEEYEELKKGGKPGPAFEIIAPKTGASASPTSAGGPPGAAPGFPRAPTDDEKKQLRDVMRSSRMKPEDREKLQNALKGIPR